MKQALLKLAFLATSIKTASYWFTIGDGVDPVMSMTISGPNEEYAVHGEQTKFNVFSINWESGSSGAPVKTVELTANANIVKKTRIQSDNTFNAVVASKTIFRFNTKPGEPDGFQEYTGIPVGSEYAYPIWGPGTNYMFVSARAFSDAVDKKLYRLHSDRITDVKTFNTGQNSRAYGILFGTPWLLVSLDATTERKLYDYTNGYDTGSNQPTSTQTKGTTPEVGMMSPEDGRSFYVVGEGQSTKIIRTVKSDNGAERLFYELSTLTGDVHTPKWFEGTDFLLATSWGDNFAIVNFMDTKKPAPTFITTHESGSSNYQGEIWSDYRTFAIQALSTKKTYVYNA